MTGLQRVVATPGHGQGAWRRPECRPFPAWGGGGPGREQRERSVAVALGALRRHGGPRRGLAAELAREHGGVARSWQRSVAEALAAFESEQAQDGDASP
ncbi:hypothetical protein [Streptomyces sp. NPDC006333]|uniref:hypothetical protein n=1 Tax=Streptomyces sp. NPDC006333 TaxID=3156753 RepID=UPI0033AB5593